MKPLTIALTGGIASGKSTIAKYLLQAGIPVFDADAYSKVLLEPGNPAYDDVVKLFGAQILLPDKRIDRKKLGQIVFTDTAKLKALETIQYDRILKAIEDFIARQQSQGSALVVIDAPLIIEAGWADKFDALWLVYLNPQTQIVRAMARDRVSAQEIEARLAKQMTFAEKKLFATDIIDNSGELAETHSQLEQLLKKYTAMK